MADLLFEFFCKPIMDYQGYNLVNTLVYGLILFLAAFFIIFPFLDKKGVKFNLKFMLALFPFIVLGSSFRILEDLHIVGRSCNPLNWQFYTFTPGIYIATFVVAIIALGISLILSKKIKKNVESIFGLIGLIVSLPMLFFVMTKFNPNAFIGFVSVIGLAVAIVLLTRFIVSKVKKDFFKDHLNTLALSGKVLDGTATFVATQWFSCGEQHVVSNIVLQNFAPAFILIKILFILVLLHYVESDVKNKNLQGFIKVLVIILGFAPGIRDLLTLAVGTCL